MCRDKNKSDCVQGAENRTKIENLDGWIKSIAVDVKVGVRDLNTKIDNITKRMAGRLPVWATVLFMAMSAVIGILATMLSSK